MRKYYFIAAGGAIGALLRYELKTAPTFSFSSNSLLNFSYNILLINLLGCLLLGMLNAVFSKTDRISNDIKLGMTTGLIGAFTTFSTFCRESLNLLNTGHVHAFIYYISVSIVLGIVAVYTGHLIGHRIIHPVGRNIVSRFGYDYN